MVTSELPSGLNLKNQVEDAERDWLQSFFDRDLSKLVQLSANDFRVVTMSGIQLEGAAFFDHVRKQIVVGSGFEIKWMDIRTNDHSATAITQLYVSLKVEGRVLEGPLLRVAAWSKVEDQWKCNLLAFYDNSLGQAWHKLTARHS